MDYNQLIEHTCRLELAGVNSIIYQIAKLDINAIDVTPKKDENEDFSNEVSDRVLKSLNQSGRSNRYTRGQHASSSRFSRGFSNNYRNRRGGKTEGIVKAHNI